MKKKPKRKYTLTKIHKDALAWKEREKKYHQFYLDFLAKNGRTPTLQEFGDKFGFTRMRAGQLLARLKKNGYLLKIEGKYHHPYYPIDWISRYTKKIKQK